MIYQPFVEVSVAVLYTSSKVNHYSTHTIIHFLSLPHFVD